VQGKRRTQTWQREHEREKRTRQWDGGVCVVCEGGRHEGGGYSEGRCERERVHEQVFRRPRQLEECLVYPSQRWSHCGHRLQHQWREQSVGAVGKRMGGVAAAEGSGRRWTWPLRGTCSNRRTPLSTFILCAACLET
jgi:hypothetical protein